MNKEINVENLINMNHRILLLLGIATSIIMDNKDHIDSDGSSKCDWFLNAIDEVVDKNNPIPEMPK